MQGKSIYKGCGNSVKGCECCQSKHINNNSHNLFWNRTIRLLKRSSDGEWFLFLIAFISQCNRSSCFTQPIIISLDSQIRTLPAHQPTQNKLRACKSWQALCLTSSPLILRTYPPVNPSSVHFFSRLTGYQKVLWLHLWCLLLNALILQRSLSQILSTTPLTGNEAVAWSMWSMSILHWWAQAWLFHRCWGRWRLKNYVWSR